MTITDIDLTSQAFKQSPLPTLGRLRDHGPLVRVRLPLVGKAWVATTYDAVNDLLRDHHRFLQNPAAAGNRWMGGLVRWLPGSLKPLTTHMLLRDPPDHRRLRGLVDQAFQRHSIDALRPRLETLADEAIERLLATPRNGRGVDLLAEFARPFPLAVICEMLGLPPEDRPRFTRWASVFSSAGGMASVLWGLFTGVSRLMQYLREEFRRQRRNPRPGLMAALIEAEEAGDRLSEDELVAMVFLLLAAGHETTLHMIALGTLELLHHPAALAELTADWRLADAAVQEFLRHTAFALFTKPRYAAEDTEFYGQMLRRGETIFACLASANTDPAAFADPDRLDIHRQPNRHVAFGAGIHVCLGAKLARVEIAVALERLFTRLPGLGLATPPNRLRYSARFGTRSLTALPVTW